jgi:hypothetical protein
MRKNKLVPVMVAFMWFLLLQAASSNQWDWVWHGQGLVLSILLIVVWWKGGFER